VARGAARVRHAVQRGRSALAARGSRRTSGHLWAWSENQVFAAFNSVPLRQSAGQ
jgi:urease accessory protein UreF